MLKKFGSISCKFQIHIQPEYFHIHVLLSLFSNSHKEDTIVAASLFYAIYSPFKWKLKCQHNITNLRVVVAVFTMFRVDKFHKSIVLLIQTLLEIEETGYVAFQGNKYQLTSYLWTAWLMATESPAHSWQRAAFNKCVFTLYLSRLLSMDCLATVSKMSIARGYLPQL